MNVRTGIGGSTTDVVLPDEAAVIVDTIETRDPLAAAAGTSDKQLNTAGRKLSGIQANAASGGAPPSCARNMSRIICQGYRSHCY